jgi:hypothetical protein
MPVSDRGSGTDAVLEAFQAELLRWNRQINLVSRRDTARRIDDLVRQCDVACDVLIRHERQARRDPAAGPLLYCDLGAGGGLPGFIWHRRLLRDGVRLQSWLVEPREKRAWFLERVARLQGAEAYGVLQGRWGEVSAPAPWRADAALLSLKALRLQDAEILAGLEVLAGPGATLPTRVVIVRFHPAGQVLTAELAADLGMVAPGGHLGRWRSGGPEVLAVAAGDHEPATLVVSTYAARNSS